MHQQEQVKVFQMKYERYDDVWACFCDYENAEGPKF